MQLFRHCRWLLYSLTPALLLLVQVSEAMAQAGVPVREDTGKSYAMGYMGVIMILAVALILVCKTSNREKDLKFQKDEDV